MNTDNLKSARIACNYTQKTIADAIGISFGTYRNYEQGLREPNNEILCKLADYFGVTTDYLLGREPADSTEDRMSQDESSLIDRYRSMTDEHKRFIETATMVVEEAERNKV